MIENQIGPSQELASLPGAAMAYARVGWHVFPLKGKLPRTEHGFKDASTDLAIIRSWWSKWPKANVGIATGACSGLIVVDQDGDATPPMGLPETITAKTARGRHLYFRYPGAIGNRTRINGLPIDLRGDGGYVVAPPSVHESGILYKWINDPVDFPLAEVPASLFQWLTSKPNYGVTNNSYLTCSDPTMTDRARKYLATLPPAISGQGGHDQTFHAACVLVLGFGLPETDAMALMSEYNQRCQPPWTETELLHKVQDAGRQPGPRGYLRDAERNGKYLAATAQESAAPSSTILVPKFPDPVLCSALRKADESKRWLLHGCLAPGAITLFSALWKSGKTTLLAHLLRAFEGGGEFCGFPVVPAKVLVVTEENESRWAERRDSLGLGDHVSFLIRPFVMKPAFGDWFAFIDHLVHLQGKVPADLIVLDTLSNLWPVGDENDAAQVQRALMPLRKLAVDDRSGMLLVHHPRKGDGQEATSTRGSGALPAFVDAILELRRSDPSDHQDRRRVLTGYARWDGVPNDLVVELAADGSGYTAQGNRQEAEMARARTILIPLLPKEPPGASMKEGHCLGRPECYARSGPGRARSQAGPVHLLGEAG